MSTFLPEKAYGFLKGEDGKDYYFSVRGDALAERFGEGVVVEFDPIATPKGYRATKCKPCASSPVDTYVVPDAVLVSRSGEVKGWSVLEMSDWLVTASGAGSPDAVKRELIQRAASLEATALLELAYSKGTGQSDNYQFTLHVFTARLAVVGKRSTAGTQLSELAGLNERAAQTSRRLLEVNQTHDVQSLLFKGAWCVAMLVAAWAAGVAGFLAALLVGSMLSPGTPPPSPDWLKYSPYSLGD